MLDVKKWMAKVTSFINANKEQTLTITGTTNANGAFGVSSYIPVGATITKASVTNYANALCIPFIYDNRLWFIKVVNWQNLNVDIANTSLNFVVKYIVGGGVLLNSIFKAFSHLQKIGGGVNAGCEEATHEDTCTVKTTQGLDLKWVKFSDRLYCWLVAKWGKLRNCSKIAREFFSGRIRVRHLLYLCSFNWRVLHWHTNKRCNNDNLESGIAFSRKGGDGLCLM